MNVPRKSKSLLLLGMIKGGSEPEFYVTKYCYKTGKGHLKYERSDLLMTDLKSTLWHIWRAFLFLSASKNMHFKIQM